MFNAADLPDTLPVFPLPGALLLPRARLPLHIFEPRYLTMLDDVLKSPQRLVGMVQPLPGADTGASAESGAPLHEIGCAGRLTAFSETPDGRYMITLTGISRYRIRNELDGFAPYRRCAVDWTPFDRDLGPPEQDPGFDRPAFMLRLRRFLDERELQTDWESLQGAEDEMLINSLAMLCPFEPEERQALLEAETLGRRREALEQLLEYALHGGPGEEVMQ